MDLFGRASLLGPVRSLAHSKVLFGNLPSGHAAVGLNADHLLMTTIAVWERTARKQGARESESLDIGDSGRHSDGGVLCCVLPGTTHPLP